MTAPRRVALYSRVSTYLQASDGISLEQQERAIREYCQRQGWPEPVPYVDAGRSAYKEAIRARPMFAKLLADVQAGTIDAVVVWHLNRWARRVRITHETIDLLSKAGVPLISLAQQLDYSSALGKLTVTLLAGVAEFESDEKSEASKRTHADLRSQGKWSGGSPPFGALRDSDGYLQLDPAKAPTLARALDLAAATTHYKAAERLNAEGHPPPGTYRKQRAFASSCWTRQSVYWLVAKGQWLLSQPDPWPQRYLAAASRPASPPVARARTVRALTGLMRCGHCGSAVVYSADLRRNVVRLRCERPGCRRTYGHAWPHEEAVRARVARLRRKSYPDPDAGVDVAAFVAIAEERRRLARLYRDPRSGLGDEEYDEGMAELDRRERQLAARGGTARDFGGIEDSLPFLDSLPPEEQNAIYAEIVAEVRVDSKHARRIVFTPAARGAFDGCD
jgi:DNA invertase Pin-like site-specific DNA recombinase